ncbi:MAG: coenzyme F420-0:L-glutamate ligase [Acholeplasmatales bacterium]|nr:coenzyme F420-0:L-glutamate ligase [Acholeplasmatales bacterium]
MTRVTGVTSRGLRGPIIKEGDNLASIVTDVVLNAAKEENFQIHDKDVIAITESVVARSQGNYAKTDAIAKDVANKVQSDTVGVVFPILSRNRFSHILEGIARGVKKIILMLSYPADEVGNHLISLDMLDEANIDPYMDVLTLKEYRDTFGYPKHEFTGIDYVEFYENLIKKQGCDVEIIFSNRVKTILDYTDRVICADIHTRHRNKRILKNAGAKVVLGLDDIMTSSVDGSGYNEKYGLLGSNMSRNNEVKLFPREDYNLILTVQKNILEATGKKVEVMVYGDGAFKDPQGKIWELADPVVSPFFTDGLIGTPNELKLKYLADNEFDSLKGEELKQAIVKKIETKEKNLVGKMETQGTTPRQLTDLLGSLCDLTSGSGDKGTPFILVQGYFDNYSDN